MGKDHTLHARVPGIVKFDKVKRNEGEAAYGMAKSSRTFVHVDPFEGGPELAIKWRGSEMLKKNTLVFEQAVEI
jgi:hypothetical protein